MVVQENAVYGKVPYFIHVCGEGKSERMSCRLTTPIKKKFDNSIQTGLAVLLHKNIFFIMFSLIKWLITKLEMFLMVRECIEKVQNGYCFAKNRQKSTNFGH